MRKYLLASLFILLAVPLVSQGLSVFFPYQGGTGSSQIPQYGDVLVGTKAGLYEPRATSTLGISGAGTVTSVDMSVPTGLSISGNPINSSGTLALTLTSGYVIPTTASTSNWQTAFSWGDHSLIGYLTKTIADTYYQAKGSYLTSESDPVWTSEKSSYLTSATASSTYQPKGSYLTSETDPVWISEKGSYLTTSDASNTYQLKGSYLTSETDPVWIADKPNYLTSAFASSTYQLKGSYLTSETDPLWTTDKPNYFTLASWYATTTDQLKEGATNKYDKVVTLTQGSNVTITGTYPDFTISASGGGGGGASALGDLTDVSLSGLANGDILVYGGGTWVNSSTNPMTPRFKGMGLNKDLDNNVAVLDVKSEASSPTTAVRVENDDAGNTAFGTWVTGNAGYLLAIKGGGKLEWSDGVSASDTNLYRSASGVLKTDGSLTATGMTLSGLATPPGAFLAVSPTGEVIATTTPQGGGGSSKWTDETGGIYYNSGKVRIGDVSSTAGLTVGGGISSPGAYSDTLINNEVFGEGAYVLAAAFNDNTIVGRGAGVTQGYATGGSTVIGAFATSTHSANTVIGARSRAQQGYSVVIGNGINTNSANSVAIGSSVGISNNGTLAIGYAASAGKTHSISLGRGTSPTRDFQMQVGSRYGTALASHFALMGSSGAYVGRNLFEITTGWTDSTDASRLSRAIFHVENKNGATEFMRADATATGAITQFLGGNVGIGTTTPAEALDVWGNARLASSDDNVYLDFFGDYGSLGMNSVTSPTSSPKVMEQGGFGTMWTNIDNAKASDNQYATVNLNYYDSSRNLRARDFGLAIPLSATVENVIVAIEMKNNDAYWIRNMLLKGMTMASGTLLGQGVPYPESTVYFHYPKDWLGNNWLPTDLNDSDFAVEIAFKEDDDSSARVDIDHITVTVIYSVEAESQTSFSMGVDKSKSAFRLTNNSALGGDTLFSFNKDGNMGIGVDNATSTLTVAGSGDFWGGIKATKLGVVFDSSNGLMMTNNGAGNYINTDVGAYLSAGGVWTDASSEVLKENFKERNADDVLSKIKGLSLTEYTYKIEDGSVKYFGAMAEEWFKVFGLDNGYTISAKNVAMIALKGIQGLISEVEDLTSRVERLERYEFTDKNGHGLRIIPGETTILEFI